MQLLTQALRQRLPGLYSQEDKGLDALAYVKFFLPDFHWKWYASEFDGQDTFFGFVDGDVPELGYFSLTELESLHGKLGLPVERDRFFRPMPLRALMR